MSNGYPGRGVDLRDPDLYLNEVPYALLSELRRESPVYWNPEADSTGFWSILRYADIAAISNRSGHFFLGEQTRRTPHLQ